MQKPLTRPMKCGCCNDPLKDIWQTDSDFGRVCMECNSHLTDAVLLLRKAKMPTCAKEGF